MVTLYTKSYHDNCFTEEVNIVNLSSATFKCLFPECKGVCCRNGRPGLTQEEIAKIQENLHKFIPLLRPEAAERITKKGFMTNRIKEGKPTLAVVKGWCIFANNGCVLQIVGTQEGDKWKYKPHLCVLFPISSDAQEKEWYIRQAGYRGEEWELPCLQNSVSNNSESKNTDKTPPPKITETLKEELEYLKNYLKKRS